MTEIPAGRAVHVPASQWSGRDDGPGPEHARWWSTVRLDDAAGADVAVVGFACDEGVTRNKGRAGAFDGPRALRGALGRMAVHTRASLADLGDVVVSGSDLEGGQELLGEVVGQALSASRVVAVLGGGHETAWGTHLGLRRAGIAGGGRRLGIINLDAHFDLRVDDRPTSGTPFRQMAEALGSDFSYWVVGIAEPGNTAAQFDRARRFGARWLTDEQATPDAVASFLTEAVAECDDIHLSIDLDVLPAHTAPGVSQPATLGVELRTIVAAVRQVAASGKLRVVDVVELNPAHDVDGRTAGVAARLVDVVADEVTRRTSSSAAGREA